MKPAIVVVMLFLVCVPPLAEAGAVTARYVGGAHVPGLIKGACFGGDASQATPGLAGACTLVIGPGPRTLSVRDDALGPRAFYWQLSPPGVAAQCAEGYAWGSLAMDIAPGCNELSVYVEVGSTTGVVRVE